MASSNTEHLQLQFIADSLNAVNSKKYHQYLQYFSQIESTLLRNSIFPCTRVVLTGSMKKRTAVHHKFDCDIIVYLQSDGSYRDVIRKKEEFIGQAKMVLRHSFPSMHKVGTTPNSFQFSIGDFDFDILPAVDLVNVIVDSHRQWRRVIELCNSQPRPRLSTNKLKASISEHGDNFINKQSDFIHRLIVLCKHWSLSNCSTSEMTSMMELIAVSVGLQMEAEGRIDLFEAFKIFLEQCSNIDNLEIEFSQAVNPMQFKQKIIKRVRPYLLDPVNLYSNRLYGMKPHLLGYLKGRVRLSLKYLDQTPLLCTSNAKCFDFENLFQLQRNLNKEGATYYNYLKFIQEMIHLNSVNSKVELSDLADCMNETDDLSDSQSLSRDHTRKHHQESLLKKVNSFKANVPYASRPFYFITKCKIVTNKLIDVNSLLTLYHINSNNTLTSNLENHIQHVLDLKISLLSPATKLHLEIHSYLRQKSSELMIEDIVALMNDSRTQLEVSLKFLQEHSPERGEFLQDYMTLHEETLKTVQLMNSICNKCLLKMRKMTVELEICADQLKQRFQWRGTLTFREWVESIVSELFCLTAKLKDVPPPMKHESVAPYQSDMFAVLKDLIRRSRPMIKYLKNSATALKSFSQA